MWMFFIAIMIIGIILMFTGVGAIACITIIVIGLFIYKIGYTGNSNEGCGI